MLRICEADMIAGDRFRVVACCIKDDQIGLNITHWVVTGSAGGGVGEADLAAYFDSNLNAAYKGWLGSNARWRGVSVQRYFPQLDVGFAVVTTDGSGSGILPCDVKQAAGLISYQTQRAGRKYRGRSYIPFPSRSHLLADDRIGVSGTTQLTLIKDFYVADHTVTTGANAVTFFPVVEHKTPPAGFQTITAGIVRDRVATQRRRGAYGRPNVPPF